MLATLLIMSFSVALAIFAATLIWAWFQGAQEFGTTSRDLAQKLAVVLFGVSFGLLGFFEQKWLEHTNEEVEEANTALGNLNMLQGAYLSGIEPAYFKNDTRFMQLYTMCFEDLGKQDDIERYCSRSREARNRLDFEDVLSSVQYFDEPIANSFLPGFEDKFNNLTYLKQHATPGNLEDLFWQLTYIRGWGDYTFATYTSARNRGDDFEKRNFTSTDLNEPAKASEFLRFQHDMCCSVWSLFDSSNHIADLGTAEAQNFCKLRENIGSAIEHTDTLTRIFEQNVIDEMKSNIQFYASDPSNCVFQPEPLDAPEPAHRAPAPIEFAK